MSIHRFGVLARRNATPLSPTYLVSEDCEGTGTPSGWTDSGTVSWDATGTVLDGAQSFQISSNASSGSWNSTKTFTEIAGTTYFFLKLRFASVSANPNLFDLRNGSTICMKVGVNSSGAWEIRDPDNGTRATGGTASINTTYNVWGDYTPGGGTTAVVNLYVATTTTKPAATVTTTSGEGTANAAGCRLQTANFTTMIADRIRISASNIAGYP